MNIANYVTLSKKSSLLRNLENSTNNIANANTNSFKKNIIINKTNKLNNVEFNNNTRTFIDSSNGASIKTGKILDFRINSDNSYFVLLKEDKIVYTKNGSFLLNRQGTLVNEQNFPVLSSSGDEINLSEKNIKEINVSQNGSIFINDEFINKFNIAYFKNTNSLMHIGNNLFISNTEHEDDDNYTIVQGSLEGSNVNPIIESTNLIEINRSMEEISKMSEVLKKTTNKCD